MVSKRISIFLIILFVFALLPVSAAETITVTNTGAPVAIFYPSEFDKLVMDFTVARADGSADVLNALTLQNDGTARGWDFGKVVVWTDAGASGFQGMAVDEKLGEATRYETGGYWYLSGLQKAVPASGLRIFVSIETGTKGAIVANKSVQMKVPLLIDGGTVGRFDLGDSGLFLAGATGVADGIINPYIQTIWVSNYDTSAPKTVITSPSAGTIITTSSFKIIGVARDQGGSTLASLQILISSGSSAGSWVDVTNTGTNYSDWEYNWTNITDGTYTIKTQGADWLGNAETIGQGTIVTVDQTATVSASAAASTVSVTPAILPADGATRAFVTVLVKNLAGNALSGKTVSLTSDRSTDNIRATKELTGADGLATFEVTGTAAGVSTLTAKVGVVTLDQKPTLTFTAVSFHAGDLIKGTASTAVYYYASDGRRYIFPTAAIYSSWFTGFSSIKTISDADLAAVPTSGNVTVRPGKLVQVVSMDTPWRVMDPKVYAVSRGGILHWVKTADAASTIFGTDWEKKIVAVPEVFATNYNYGADINLAVDYNLAAEQAIATIDQDKGF
ncbi:Ig-like domain-containing protein [Candidatus Falkowbacteria bacterium]|nr:Ig-like domain-containing protein [Candidatus Falkowbacteria bacterium]